MLIQLRYADAIARGEVTITFRRWKRPQVVAGNTYRTGAGRIVVDSIDIVDPQRITAADARRAGFASKAELMAQLRGTDDLPTYRIRFHPAVGGDPRTTLAGDAQLTGQDVEQIRIRLERLDRASSHGPWTLDVLHAIQ